MSYPLYSFTGAANPDQTQQAGLAQYMAQGQLGINPGQVQTQASDPITAAAQSGLGKALTNLGQQSPSPAQLPPDISQQALAQGPMQTGTVGPTPQNLALAQQLMQQQNNPFQNLPQSYGMSGVNY